MSRLVVQFRRLPRHGMSIGTKLSSSARWYASVSKDNPEEEEYEIDLITLQKKYKPKHVSPPSSSQGQQLHSEPFDKEFRNELNLLKDFLAKNPTLIEFLSAKNNNNKLSVEVIERVLAKFKSSFFKDYLSNQLKCDVSKIYQMCNYLQKNDQVFKKLLVKNEDDQINEILKVFSKPLEKRRRKEPLESSSAETIDEKSTESTTPPPLTEDIDDDFEIKLDDYISRENTHTLSAEPVPKSRLRDGASINYDSAVKLLNLTRKKADNKGLDLEQQIKTRAVNHDNKHKNIPFLDNFAKKVVTDSSSSTSLDTSRVRKEDDSNVDDLNLQKLSASAIRDKYAKLYKVQDDIKVTTELKEQQQEPLESIESFLKKLKQTNDISKAEEFRRQKAYEWSKYQLSENKLESGRFFSPKLIPGTLIPFDILNPFNKNKSTKNDLLFPKLNKKNQRREYLLLTSSGKTINCGYENPLGFNYVARDFFTILNNLENPEIFIRHIQKLSQKNWKLIGGGDDKILIFERLAKPRFVWKFMKNFFTFIGILSTGLILGSFFIDPKTVPFGNNMKQIKSVAQVDQLE